MSRDEALEVPTPSEQDIRRLSDSDIQDYRTIRLHTLRMEPDLFGSLFSEEIKRPVAEFAQVIATASVFGAYVDGRIAGVIRLHAGNGTKELHKGSLHGFFVLPEYRGRGLGLALISMAIETARTSLEQLTLSVVATNYPAIRLYEQLGFKRYGVEPRARMFEGAYTDVVLMVMILSSVTGEPRPESGTAPS